MLPASASPANSGDVYYDDSMVSVPTRLDSLLLTAALCALLIVSGCSKTSEKSSSASAAAKPSETKPVKRSEPPVEPEQSEQQAAATESEPVALAPTKKPEPVQRVVRPTLKAP